MNRDVLAKHLIRDTLALLDGGRAWCRGHGREDEHGPADPWLHPAETRAWCVSEALRDEGQWVELRYGALGVQARALADALILETANTVSGWVWESVPEWNDAPGREWVDVEKVLTEAAA